MKSYESYYQTELVPEVRKQYMINDGKLKDLLVSPVQGKIIMDILHAPVVLVECNHT